MFVNVHVAYIRVYVRKCRYIERTMMTKAVRSLYETETVLSHLSLLLRRVTKQGDIVQHLWDVFEN